MKEKGKKNIVVIMIFAIVLIVLVSGSYAYSRLNAVTSKEQEISSTSGTLSLEYAECTSQDTSTCATVSGSLEPGGDALTKIFYVKNTGTAPVTFNPIFKELQNTFTNDELVYKLEDITDEANPEVVIAETAVPYNTTLTTEVDMPAHKTLARNETVKYKFSVRFIDTNEEQSYNADATFSIKLGVKQYEPTMASYIKNSVYGTDTTLYLHSDTATGNNETSIANWTNAESGNANDGAYRYSGPDADVHNYICFGTSDKDACLNDTSDNGNSKYLFRIISVEGDNVKLIKALPLYNTKTSAATFRWDYQGSTDSSTYSNSWSKPSTLKEYLNTGTSSRANYSSNYPDTGYLQSWSSDWQSKIADNMTWYVGGYSSTSVKVKTFYNAEHGTCTSGTCPGTTDTTTKIGLMNVYDYGYAASPTSWAINTIYNYGNATIRTNNWLYRSTNISNEWTITPNASNAYYVFIVGNNGRVSFNNAFGGDAVRPVFYLTSNVAYKSGTGTSTDPFLIS